MTSETEISLFEYSELPFSWHLLSQIYDYRWQLAKRGQLFMEVEELYDAKGAQLVAKFEKDLQSTEDEEVLVSDFAMASSYLSDELPSIHRAATFTMLYHFLEAGLGEICDGIADELQSVIRLQHLKGQGIERALLFLTLVGKLDLTQMQRELEFLRHCNKLRNVVVHAAGHVDPGNRALLAFLMSEPTLEKQAGPEVVITKGFVLGFIDALRSLFVGIHDAMQDFMRASGNTGPAYLIGEMGTAPVYGPDPRAPG